MIEQRTAQELANEYREFGGVRIASPTGLSMAIPAAERKLLEDAAQIAGVDVDIRRVGDEVRATATRPAVGEGALVMMTLDELASHRQQCRDIALSTNDPTGRFMTRVALIDALIADRKANRR